MDILKPTAPAARTKFCRCAHEVPPLRAAVLLRVRSRARMTKFGLLGIVVLSAFVASCSGVECGDVVSLLGECQVAPYYVGGRKALVSSAAPFAARAGHTSLVFDGKLWVIGGGTTGAAGTSEYYNDVWFSENGKDWVEAVADTAASSSQHFTQRAEHTSVVFDDKLWVIGGKGVDSTGNLMYFKNVWSSVDGMAWVKEPDAPFAGLASHTSLVFDDKLWVIGGENILGNSPVTVGPTAEMWFSADGKSWTKAFDNSKALAIGYPLRSEHASAVYGGKMWIIGGRRNAAAGNQVPLNDVWSSSDGINWIQENAAAPFSARSSLVAVDFAELLIIFGGRAGDAGPDLNDTWTRSDDGAWTESPTNLLPRSGNTLVILDQKLFFIGGVNGAVFYNDVWSAQ